MIGRHLTYLILLLSLLFTSCKETTTSPKYDISDAKLKVKSSKGLEAGTRMTFLVSTKENKTAPMTMIISNGLTTQTYPIFSSKKIELDENTFTHSGKYTVDIAIKDSILISKQFKIKASDLTDPIEIYTGPASIIVGGKQPSLVTAIPSDSYDNGITKEKKIQYKSSSSKGIIANVAIKNMHASLDFDSDELAEKVLIGVSQDSIYSGEQAVEEVADWATDFNIEVVEQYPYADNRQYTRLRTSRVQDNYGNQIADGTLVTFQILENNKPSGIYKAIIIDGVANIYIRNPGKQCTFDIIANIGRYSKSEKLSVIYKNNLKVLMYDYDAFAKTISVGPLKSVLGQFITDGTEVSIEINGKKIAQETVNGRTTFHLVNLGILSKDELTISCSGITKKIQLR